MQRKEFLSQPEVSAFIEWLAQTLLTLTVELRFKSSKFVPGGLKASVTGFEQVLGHYRWCAAWQPPAENEPLRSECWGTTRASLQKLGDWLASAVAADDQVQALQACLQVLRWGGVRGAIPFLNRLADEGRLTAYLKSMRDSLALDTDADLDKLSAHNVERFDAGLTKIHALLDASGSPIYDSRVGAAMSMLHAQFRAGYAGVRLPRLVFPSGAARGDQIRDPGAFTGMQKAPQFSRLAYHEWAQAQLQLGWIIRSLLERTEWFAGEGDLAARCHAFEACLFMLGYDLRCFGHGQKLAGDQGADLVIAGIPSADVEAPSETKESGKWVPTSHPFVQVLQDYLRFREAGNAAESGAFRVWMRQERQISEATARSYCYPFSEFDLWQRPIDALRVMAQGGEAALYVALGSDASLSMSDELESVCLASVWLAGRAYECEPESGDGRANLLIKAGFAGTFNSVNALLGVGRNVGSHFGLLDKNHRPTALFKQFFSGAMDDFEERLSAPSGRY
jgi:hypothetical protein